MPQSIPFGKSPRDPKRKMKETIYSPDYARKIRKLRDPRNKKPSEFQTLASTRNMLDPKPSSPKAAKFKWYSWPVSYI